MRVVLTLSQSCSGRVLCQFGEADEVVSGYRQLRPHLVASHSPVPQLATASDRLHPAEHLLNAFAEALTQSVSAVPGGPSVDCRMSSLSHVRCDVHVSAVHTKSLVSYPLSAPTVIRPLPDTI